MAYGTINADVVQSSVTGVSLGAGNATVFKNRIINGDMRIDQRNAGASVTPIVSNTYLTDRWQAILTVSSKYSAQQNAGSVTPPAGFINYLGITSLSAYAVGASDAFSVTQFIEGLNIADLGWGTANAKTVTLSAWVYSSLTGTFGGSLINSATNRSYPFTYTISSANTWTQISITIPGDTSGTWLTTNGIGIRVYFSLGMGSTYSGTAGAWASGFYESATGATSVVGTSGATFYITGVQLEVGSSATGFEYNDYGKQLIQCQRYLFAINTVGAGDVGIGTTVNNAGGAVLVSFPVTPRTPPTGISVTSAASFAITTASIAATVTSITFNNAGPNASRLSVSSASTSFTGSQPLIFYSGSAGGQILFTGSEL
jgi:hypothetical protein